MRAYCLDCSAEVESVNSRCEVCHSEALAPVYQRLNPDELAKIRSLIGRAVSKDEALQFVRRQRVELAFEAWLARSTDAEAVAAFAELHA